MLTGEKPYTGEHLTTVVYKIVTEEPVPPHRLNPTLGGAIEAALRKALAADLLMSDTRSIARDPLTG